MKRFADRVQEWFIESPVVTWGLVGLAIVLLGAISVLVIALILRALAS